MDYHSHQRTNFFLKSPEMDSSSSSFFSSRGAVSLLRTDLPSLFTNAKMNVLEEGRRKLIRSRWKCLHSIPDQHCTHSSDVQSATGDVLLQNEPATTYTLQYSTRLATEPRPPSRDPTSKQVSGSPDSQSHCESNHLDDGNSDNVALGEK